MNIKKMRWMAIAVAGLIAPIVLPTLAAPASTVSCESGARPAQITAAYTGSGRCRANTRPSTLPYNSSRGPNSTNRVILTFDDCPNSLAALRSMLIAARNWNVGMVLAPYGDCIRRYKAATRIDIASLARYYGQYVINHSATHRDLTQLRYAQVLQELGSPGVVTNYGRPPYLAHSAKVDAAYSAMHMREWFAGQDTRDYLNKTQAQVVGYVVSKARPGDTILMHMMWRGFNPLALRQMINGLAARGIRLCPAHAGTTPVLLAANIC